MVKNECCPVIHDDLYDLYSSQNIIRFNKSRVMGLVGYAERMGGRGEVHTGSWWGKSRERGHLEDQGADRRIILKLTQSGLGTWTGLIWLRIGTDGGLL